MINIHRHCFKIGDAPEGFVPALRPLTKRLQSSPKRLHRTIKILDKVLPSGSDALSRYSDFLRMYEKTTEEIMQDGALIGEEFSVFLSMDMRYMGRGHVPTRYIDQLDEFVRATLSRGRGDKLFVHVDPRADNREEILDWMKANDEHVAGIKLYCPLGYYPNDCRLDMFYREAVVRGWAVMSHCTPHSPVYYSGKHLDSLLHKNDEYYVKASSKKKKCANFAHPSHLLRLARRWPAMNICAAHFGGKKDWFDYLKSAIVEQDNLWADISFTFNEPSEVKELLVELEDCPAMGDKVMFGTDHYMTKTLKSVEGFLLSRRILGRKFWDKVSDKNPRKYLGL